MQSLGPSLLLILSEHGVGELILGLEFCALHVGTWSFVEDDLALDHSLHQDHLFVGIAAFLGLSVKPALLQGHCLSDQVHHSDLQLVLLVSDLVQRAEVY